MLPRNSAETSAAKQEYHSVRNRILILLLLVLALAGCQRPKTLEITKLESFPVDMSAYKGMNSVKHRFVGTSPKELLRCIEEGGSALFYIGDTDCANCQEAVRIINEVAENHDLSVYYIFAYDKKYPLSAYHEEVQAALEPLLPTDETGTKRIKMPLFFSVENGVPSEAFIGLAIDATGTSVDREKMIRIYEKVIGSFID